MNIQIIEEKFYYYSLHTKGFSSNTIKRYKYAIQFYCRFAHIETIHDVTEDNVRALFLEGRINRHWKPNTSAVFYKSLMSFFRWCIRQKYLSSNPLSEIEIPKLASSIPARLTKQEAVQLLEVVYNYPYEYRFLRYRNHALFSVLLFAGLRRSELLHLRLTDVDVENLTIFVWQGKGAKDRMVPISHTLAQTLEKYIQERKRLRKTCPEFFASGRLNSGLTSDGLNHLVKAIKQASGLSFTVHALRHTFATLMLEGGCDIYSLSKMMGHTDIKTTSIYLAASVGHLRGQAQKHPLNDCA